MSVNSADLKAVDWEGVIHEDLMRVLFDISAKDLPFYEFAGDAERSTDIYKSWVEDTLAEGDPTDAKIDAGTLTAGGDESTGERVGNHVQITTKDIALGKGAQAVDSVGGIGTMAYQVAQRQIEVYRNVETRALSNFASVAPVAKTTAGETAGMDSALKTNTNRAGSDGGFSSGIVAAPTVGARRSISETDVRSLLQQVYVSNGNPTVLMGTPSVVNGFADMLFDDKARVGVLRTETASGRAPGQSEAGTMADGMITTYAANNVVVDLVPNRRQRTYNDSPGGNPASTLFAFDRSQCGISWQIMPTASEVDHQILGDSRYVYAYYCVWYGVEKAHGCIDCINEATPFVPNS